MPSDMTSNSVEISGGSNQGFIHVNNGTVTQNFITHLSACFSEQALLNVNGLTREECRQRKVLLNKVNDYWIKGVLEKSLYIEAMIQLGLEKRSDLVESPFAIYEGALKDSRHSLLEGTDATRFFEQMGDGRTLLILGEPGSGKSITLLKLAQTLITRAEKDISQAIPVIFNLSSWSRLGLAKRQSMANWLVEELWSKYGVPKSVGKGWIKSQQLILLLDALDEVQIEYREACVKAINQFMEDNGQTEIVVCSRIVEYEALSAHLRLRGALVIRDLTSEQIKHYLDEAGEQLEPIKVMLLENPIWQEFSKSPLMLSVMTVAYLGASTEELDIPISVVEERQRIFDAYIQRMFSQERLGKPREYTSPYANEQTRSWLNWLAKQMVRESQNVFLIESIQPSLLRSQHQLIAYILSLCLINGCLFYFIGERLWGGALFCLVTTSILVLNEFGTLIWKWNRLQSGLLSGLAFAIVGGVTYGLSSSLNLKSTLEVGAVFGLIGGSFVGLFVSQVGSLTRIIPTESLHWSWDNVPRWFAGGMLFGLILGLVMGSGFSFDVGNRLVAGLRVEVFGGLIGGLFFGLIGSVLGGWTGIKMEIKSVPNQGILNSAQNFLIVFVGFLALVGFLGVLLAYLVYRLANEFISASIHETYVGILILGLAMGLLFALSRGGEACLQHFLLRCLLYQQNRLPWNYARFLDYAADRGFLRKVGGGYIFIHRMLEEHFALMPSRY